MSMYTEEMKLWLFDLAHGNLADSDILKGFFKHYVLYNGTIDDVVRDIVFHTMYGEKGIKFSKENIMRVLGEQVI